MSNSGLFPELPPEPWDGTEGVPKPHFKIEKRGMKIPMSWEQVVGSKRKGEYVPVGNRYAQLVSWWAGKQLFRIYQLTERRLQRFRAYREVSGYDYEEAYYDDFKQERKWVDDAEGA